MSNLDKISRVEFLSEKFGVFDNSNDDTVKKETDIILRDGVISDVKPFNGSNGDDIIALVCVQEVNKKLFYHLN